MATEAEGEGGAIVEVDKAEGDNEERGGELPIQENAFDITPLQLRGLHPVLSMCMCQTLGSSRN